jgi:hypothetical protein
VLREGITPRGVVLEIVPSILLGQEGPKSDMAVAGDLPVLLRHTDNVRVWAYFLRNRLNPFFKHRLRTLEGLAPSFVTKANESDSVTLEPLGDDRKWMRVEQLDPARLQIRTQQIVEDTYARLQDWHLDPLLDAATREFLRLCHERSIPVVLLLTPESGPYRSWYREEVNQRLAAYLGQLREEFGVATVDARTWVDDAGFYDPHHLTTAGATTFTARLGQEVLRPLVEGRPFSPSAVPNPTIVSESGPARLLHHAHP